jgi:hypothetical protein
MKKKLLLAISVAALAVASASAKSYSVQLFEPAMLGSTPLTPGEYKVQVEDQKAMVSNGKIHCEATVKVESADTKYGSTSVRFTNADGKMHIQEIHIGGSKTKLVFNE